MWSDNEAEIDLLGFEYLVDSLIAVLGESQPSPADGRSQWNWGSGKSSLMRMAANRLKKDSGYLVIEFSPWVHEDYDDVKTSLIATILDELATARPDPGSGRLDRLWGLLSDTGAQVSPVGCTSHCSGSVSCRRTSRSCSGNCWGSHECSCSV